MADPRRLESTPPADAVDRDSRIERLLVEGLDHYFAGQFEDAVHLWTRVLFLDRSHARARAYIDRARTAMAERQRRGDQLLEESRTLLAQGLADEALEHLTAARQAGGDAEQVSSLQAQLERQTRFARVARPLPVSPAPLSRPASHLSGRPRTWWSGRTMTAGVMVFSLLLLGMAAATSPAVAEWLGVIAAPDRPVLPVASQKWPVPTSAEVALVRARTLYRQGRLAEAMRELDAVPEDAAERGAADTLRLEIERVLLAGDRLRAPTTGER